MKVKQPEDWLFGPSRWFPTIVAAMSAVFLVLNYLVGMDDWILAINAAPVVIGVLFQLEYEWQLRRSQRST